MMKPNASFRPGITRYDTKKSGLGTYKTKPSLKQENSKARNLSMRSTQQHSAYFRQYSVQSRQDRPERSIDNELFVQSSRRLKKLRSDHRHSLQQLNKQIRNQLDNILDIVNQQKIIIKQTMKKMNEKAQKYKSLYEQQQKKISNKQQLSEGSKDLYDKFVVILKQMNINPKQVLPPLQQQQSQEKQQQTESNTFKDISKDEIIRVQKFLIKKLIKKLQQQ